MKRDLAHIDENFHGIGLKKISEDFKHQPYLK
jgi:hypothetical protein